MLSKQVLIKILHQLERLNMTVESKLDQIIAQTSTAATVDLTPVLAAISALSAKVDALQATVGTETPVTPPVV